MHRGNNEKMNNLKLRCDWKQHKCDNYKKKAKKFRRNAYREKKYDAQIKQRKQQQIYDERERQRQIQQQQTEYERQMQIYNAEVREAERARGMQD